MQPALTARAAPGLKEVVDGGVTELVPSSIIGSLSAAEKKVCALSTVLLLFCGFPVWHTEALHTLLPCCLLTEVYLRGHCHRFPSWCHTACPHTRAFSGFAVVCAVSREQQEDPDAEQCTAGLSSIPSAGL